jgi:hypothetical protein
MFSQDTRTLLALIQAIVGYEWLISGANMVLSGQFSWGLGRRLAAGLKDNPTGWYVSFLRPSCYPTVSSSATRSSWPR